MIKQTDAETVMRRLDIVASVESDELCASNPRHRAWLEQKLKNYEGAGADFFGVFEQGEIVAFATVLVERRLPDVFGGSASAELLQIGVDLGLRRRGAGAALLAHIEDWLRAQNASCLYLHTYETDEVAVSFYERCGFKKAGVVPGVYGPSFDGMVYLYKLL